MKAFAVTVMVAKSLTTEVSTVNFLPLYEIPETEALFDV
jgi:hypothetical protein